VARIAIDKRRKLGLGANKQISKTAEEKEENRKPVGLNEVE
jgi:hypothetical protein